MTTLDLALHEPAGHTSALLAAAEEPASPDYARAVAAMETWPPRRWLELDAIRLDAWSWYGGELAPRRGWPAVLERRNAPILLLVLASTHRDGSLRERATRALAGHAGPLASAALAVRAVDHVPEVREVARQALNGRREVSDAGAVVPILLAARQREAAAGVLEHYLDRLAPETLRSLVSSQERETRRLAVKGAPFSSPELVRVAASDPDIQIRLIAARRAVAQDQAAAGDLLAVRPASVRALAVAVAADSLVRPHLEQLFLDRSAHLRHAAQARARELGVDAATLYRSHLPARKAVLGVGETGSARDLELLLPLVGGGEPAPIRRAAMHALAQLASREQLFELLPPLLEDDQPSIAREAGRQLRRLGFSLTGSSLDRALRSKHAWTRQAGLAIALGRRGWDVPVAALALYNDGDESLREYARSALGAWLAHRAATAGRPNAEQAAQLRDWLVGPRLPRDLARLVRFHAGL